MTSTSSNLLTTTDLSALICRGANALRLALPSRGVEDPAAAVDLLTSTARQIVDADGRRYEASVFTQHAALLSTTEDQLLALADIARTVDHPLIRVLLLTHERAGRRLDARLDATVMPLAA